MRARVERNDAIAPGAWRLAARIEEGLGPAEAGQFVLVRMGAGLDPLLPRPFSVYRIEGGAPDPSGALCEIVFRVVGRGTRLLAALAPGAVLEVSGPYGRGFRLLDPRGSPGPAPGGCVIVAGGMGIASLYRLAERAAGLLGRERVHVLFGARTRADLICLEDIERLGLAADLATEDGSTGWKGTILERLLARAGSEGLLGPGTTVYACGPHGMLKGVADVAARAGASCQVALERVMACGMGACLGCAVRVRDGTGHGAYEMVCKDGPVFDAARVDWER